MAEKRKPYIKWYTRDWRSSAKLRLCSYGARGLWADMISLMAESEHFGFLIIEGVVPTCKQLAGLLGGTERDVTKLRAELGDANVYSVTGFEMPDDVKALIPEGMPDGVILSRRMLRDKAKADKDRDNGGKGGNPKLVKVRLQVMPGVNRKTNPHSHSYSHLESSSSDISTDAVRDAAPERSRSAPRTIPSVKDRTAELARKFHQNSATRGEA